MVNCTLPHFHSDLTHVWCFYCIGTGKAYVNENLKWYTCSIKYFCIHCFIVFAALILVLSTCTYKSFCAQYNTNTPHTSKTQSRSVPKDLFLTPGVKLRVCHHWNASQNNIQQCLLRIKSIFVKFCPNKMEKGSSRCNNTSSSIRMHSLSQTSQILLCMYYSFCTSTWQATIFCWASRTTILFLKLQSI